MMGRSEVRDASHKPRLLYAAPVARKAMSRTLMPESAFGNNQAHNVVVAAR